MFVKMIYSADFLGTPGYVIHVFINQPYYKSITKQLLNLQTNNSKNRDPSRFNPIVSLCPLFDVIFAYLD